uniref:Peptidase S74 domain-containing protein n=1 Tax=Mycena chlorophos TaxID=658473 RepID=A0ABQ0KUL3_MYCCL|nr:predicted protein [Mycena chlorophos]
MGFISDIFGGSKSSNSSSQSSSSQNVNNDLLKSDFSGQIANGTNANNIANSLLTGTGDTAAANAGYQNYLQQAGYAPALKQLSQNLTGQGAASGLLNSGSTTKALANYGAQLNNQFYQNYLQNLNNQTQAGTQAGGLLAGTGQTSQSSGTSSGGSTNNNGLLGGVGSVVGGIASIFSDRRLKTDIEKIGEASDGLGWYRFRYIWDRAKEVRGVMADEVARLRPWALGPVVGGFSTVNYGDL